MQTIFWHDYETWGANPQKDPACQFAGIRTDLDLNIVGKPVNLFCQIPNDYLPHPQACLVTGITPQQSLRDGSHEAEFIRKIYEHISQPQTCVAGYNSIRFDDEVTRYTLYRNFYDPYAREWQNGNSRWDIIDLVRACYALRPEGIQWTYREDGSPSFKLELLSEANGISHEDAHDAMSDVYATISLAKLAKTAQPRLYQYLFELRDKRKVSEHIDCFNMHPFVHISSKLPAAQGCCTWMVPIAHHPKNKNAVICLDLAIDPTPVFELDTEQLQQRLYSKASDLAADEIRPGIKLIHINKCPVVAPAKTLTEENAERLGIDRKQCLDNLKRIKAFTGIQQKLLSLYEEDAQERQLDPDFALYTGGFFSDSDKTRMERIRSLDPDTLALEQWQFDDPRLNTLLFRYRARNFPQTLSEQEMERWQRHRQFRFLDPASDGSITLQNYMQTVESLAQQYPDDHNKLAILKSLFDYGQQL